MKPPPMCPACEFEVGVTYLREGAAAAMLIHRENPCPHVVRYAGVTFVPDEKCNPDWLMPYAPHPLVAQAYGYAKPVPSQGPK
jgi:hypothetical protein